MKQELYFDISNGEVGGSLYRQADGSFLWHYSTYDDERDETRLFQTSYPSFAGFWAMMCTDPQWHFQHPLFVHPEVRPFVGEQLEQVDWTLQGDLKWQLSHQRQWTKVLSDRPGYYHGGTGV